MSVNVLHILHIAHCNTARQQGFLPLTRKQFKRVAARISRTMH